VAAVAAVAAVTAVTERATYVVGSVASMAEAGALAQRLGVQPEILPSTPFDSLVIEGLAVAEVDP
jgi:hypothetical protein